PEQVAEVRAELQPAPRAQARRKREVVVGCEVEVVRHGHFRATARGDRKRRGQQPALALLPYRKEEDRRGQDAAIAKDQPRTAPGAAAVFLVDVQLPRLDAP